MFKFLKELIDAATEGAEEGRANVASARAARGTGARRHTSAARDAGIHIDVRAVRCCKRNVMIGELRAAKRDERPAAYLQCIAIPEAEVASMTSLLARDFDADSAEGAHAACEALLQAHGDSDAGLDASHGAANAAAADERALLAARTCHLATGAAAVGLLGREEALALLVPMVERTFAEHADWAAYGAAFLRGERDAPGSNVLGRKVLASTVEALGSDPESPLQQLPWPQDDAARQAVLDSR